MKQAPWRAPQTPPLVPVSRTRIPPLGEFGMAAPGVLQVRVAAVDDDVAGREQRSRVAHARREVTERRTMATVQLPATGIAQRRPAGILAYGAGRQ
jgi:hypothetical protein